MVDLAVVVSGITMVLLSSPGISVEGEVAVVAIGVVVSGVDIVVLSSPGISVQGEVVVVSDVVGVVVSGVDIVVVVLLSCPEPLTVETS